MTEETSKSSVGKWIAGCGCTLVLALLLLGGIAVWGTYTAAKKVQEMASTVSIDEFDPSDLAEFKERVLPAEYTEHAKKFVDAIARPLSVEDVDRFVAATEWFYSQPQHEQALLAVQALSGDSDGLMELFEKQRGLVESHEELLDLMRRFNNYVGFNGGYVKQADAALRTVAVAASADLAGKALDKPAESDRVADEMQEFAARTKSLAKDGDDAALRKVWDELGMTEVKFEDARPVLIAMLKTPEGSFETWSKLGRPKRKEALKAYRRQASVVLSAQLNPILKTLPVIERLRLPGTDR